MEYEIRKKRIDQLPDDTMFYIQSYGYIGNCISFWKEGRKGYTTNIAKAQIFTKTEVLEQLSFKRDQDVFYEAGEVELKSVRMVDMQDIDKKYRY